MRLHKGQILLQDVLYFSLRDQQREKGKKILPSLEEGWHVVFESGNAKLQLENLFLLTEFSPSLQLIVLMWIYPVLIWIWNCYPKAFVWKALFQADEPFETQLHCEGSNFVSGL